MPKRNTFQDVFRHYDLTGGNNDGRIHHERCWKWKGSTNAKNQPYFSVDGKTYIAYRIVYHVTHPTEFRLDDPRLIRHVVCDNNLCGNPRHMIPGTHQDNMNDAVEHARFGLTREEIHAIVSLHEQYDDLTHQRIAEKVSYQFKRNIARSTVTDVLSGRRKQRRKEQKDG